ncbi:MAG: class I SAM-dependent methyltransferase [Chloroflexales bacterium]
MLNRLYPPRTSTRYYSLVRLREAIERVADSWLPAAPTTLVDLGCGAMPYRPILEPRVARYIGVDLRDNPRADLYMPADGRVPLADASVDIVLSSQVLEHVVSPAAYLSECQRILRPGGILILSTHGYWLYHPNPTDYWRWTGSGLARQIALAGLELQHQEGIMGLGAAAIQLLQDAILAPIPPRLHAPFGLLIQPFVALADACSSPTRRARDACIYLMVARRPLVEVLS